MSDYSTTASRRRTEAEASRKPLLIDAAAAEVPMGLASSLRLQPGADFAVLMYGLKPVPFKLTHYGIFLSMARRTVISWIGSPIQQLARRT